MPVGKDEIAMLIPHAGAMCLLVIAGLIFVADRDGIDSLSMRKLAPSASNSGNAFQARHHTSCTTSSGSTCARIAGRMRRHAQVYSAGAMRS